MIAKFYQPKSPITLNVPSDEMFAMSMICYWLVL